MEFPDKKGVHRGKKLKTIVKIPFFSVQTKKKLSQCFPYKNSTENRPKPPPNPDFRRLRRQFSDFPEIFEELLHTLMEFLKFSENFRRITTHTYGFFVFSTKFPRKKEIISSGIFRNSFSVYTTKKQCFI